MDRKPIYQAVVSIEPYTIREFKDFESAREMSCILIIKKIYIGKHTTRYGNDYDNFNYTFHIDLDNISTSFSINNWSIEEIHEGYCGTKHRVEKGDINVTAFDSWNDFVLSDPDGEVRTIYFRQPENALKKICKSHSKRSFSSARVSR